MMQCSRFCCGDGVTLLHAAGVAVAVRVARIRHPIRDLRHSLSVGYRVI